MTTLPAERLCLKRRGRLAPGYAADVVVFDPDSIADRATFSMPHQYSTGVSDVLVNGLLAVTAGEPTGSTAGRVIKSATD